MGGSVDSAVITNCSKRVRDEQVESTESKRLRAADLILLDFLEDVDSAAPPAGDLALVLKSFEEEITALSSCPSQEQTQAQQREWEGGAAALRPPHSESTSNSEDLMSHRRDLDYLLEASDDDLGLPPASPPWSEREAAAQAFGQTCNFDDEVAKCYEALVYGDFGQLDDGFAAADPDAAAMDGGLFAYSGGPDLSADCPRMAGSLQAL